MSLSAIRSFCNSAIQFEIHIWGFFKATNVTLRVICQSNLLKTWRSGLGWVGQPGQDEGIYYVNRFFILNVSPKLNVFTEILGKTVLSIVFSV